MIIDAFLYAGETEMLDLRVRTLAGTVDAFVAVSADHTHQGDPIPDPVDRFWCGPEDVHYYVEPVGDVVRRFGTSLVGTRGYQRVERAQRVAIRGAVLGVSDDPDTIVLVSDVDEIPEPSIVRDAGWLLDAARENAETPWLVLEQRFHSTTLDQLHPAQPWLGTTVSRLRELRPQAMRDARGPDSTPIACRPIRRGGWHFSWFGTADERLTKRATISHGELVRDRYVCRACRRPEWDAGRAERAVSDPELTAYEDRACRFCGADDGYERLEPFDVFQRETHSNGEALRLLSPLERLALDWPEPIVDGTFWTPDSWNYSGKGGDVR